MANEKISLNTLRMASNEIQARYKNSFFLFYFFIPALGRAVLSIS